MNRSICFTELIKDENGFYKAGQTIETACIRTYLKEKGINSTIYVDESLPSINDMCDDILSLSDEVIVFVVNNECKKVMRKLVSNIMNLEDIEAYVIGETLDIEEVINLNENPEQKLAELLGEKDDNKELSILSVSPYKSGILQARDINKYGIWIGNNTYGMRNIEAIKEDIQEVTKAYSGLSEAEEKVVCFKGDFINNKEFLTSVVNEVLKSNINFLKFNISVDGICFDDSIISESNSKLIYSLKFTEALEEDKADEFIKVIKSKRVYEVYIDVSLFVKENKFTSIILSASKAHLINLVPVGELEVEKVSKETLNILLDNTRKRYLPFYRGFINSRVGSYPVNKLDGYVRHLQVSEELINENSEFFNEIMKVNSSVYIKDKDISSDKDKYFFNENGVANVNNKGLESIEESLNDNNANISNIIEIDDRGLHNNYLAYVSSGDIHEISYKEGKELLETIKENSVSDKKAIYIFKLTDAEDFELFLEDAEKYRESHKLTDLLLGYGYLENSCRFLSPSGCSADKIPRLKIDNNGGIHTCDLAVEASSKIGDSLFEIEHSSMTKRAKKLNERGCYECPTKIWCPKCSELPDFISEKYCEIMKRKTYVLDYVMAPFIVIRLKDINKVYRDTSNEKIIVSNEYMYNYISTDLRGEVAPYLPKFTSILSIDSDCLLWAPTAGKFYKISVQFAYVIELLLRRVKAESIEGLICEMLKVDEESSKKIVDIVFNTLKTAGILYRDIK